MEAQLVQRGLVCYPLLAGQDTAKGNNTHKDSYHNKPKIHEQRYSQIPRDRIPRSTQAAQILHNKAPTNLELMLQCQKIRIMWTGFSAAYRLILLDCTTQPEQLGIAETRVCSQDLACCLGCSSALKGNHLIETSHSCRCVRSAVRSKTS